MMIDQIARIIANFILALDYSEEEIHEDDVVKILEQIGSDFQGLDPESRVILSDAFRRIAPEYEGEFRDTVKTIPESFGIEDDED